jgi:DNA gyrase subunit A
MGRTAHGVRGIRLRKDDRVVSLVVADPGATILTVTEHGYGKRSELDEYRLTARGGVGVKTCRVTDKNGPVVSLMQVAEDDDIMLITDGGMVIRTQVKQVSVLGRDTQGVRLIDLREGEKVVGCARLVERDGEEDKEEGKEEGMEEGKEGTGELQKGKDISDTKDEKVPEDGEAEEPEDPGTSEDSGEDEP